MLTKIEKEFIASSFSANQYARVLNLRGLVYTVYVKERN